VNQGFPGAPVSDPAVEVNHEWTRRHKNTESSSSSSSSSKSDCRKNAQRTKNFSINAHPHLSKSTIHRHQRESAQISGSSLVDGGWLSVERGGGAAMEHPLCGFCVLSRQFEDEDEHDDEDEGSFRGSW
jgi:hypothetical protein